MVKRRMGIMAFLFCLCLWLLPCGAQAISTSDAVEPIGTQRECSLTIGYRSGGISCDDMEVKLYRIAEVSADVQYTPTPSFDGYGLVLNNIQSAGEWNQIRKTLEAHISADRIPADEVGLTNEVGEVCFAPLEPGLYLAITEPFTHGDLQWVFDAVLISLPTLDVDGVWQYHPSVNAKPEVLPPIGPDEVVEYQVLKLWKGDGEQNSRPQSIEVEIFRNGTSVQRVLLSEENHWSYRWRAENDGAQWSVVERNVPAGYYMLVEERTGTFVLTNVAVPQPPDDPQEPQDTDEPKDPQEDDGEGEEPSEDEEDAPNTGDTSNIWLYTILMYLSGGVLVILGLTGKRKGV